MAWDEVDGAVIGGSFAGATAALQCPHCHGFEAADRTTAVLMTGPRSLHPARILGAWTGDPVLLANGRDPGDEDRADLRRRGARVAEGRVRNRVAGEAPRRPSSARRRDGADSPATRPKHGHGPKGSPA